MTGDAVAEQALCVLGVHDYWPNHTLSYCIRCGAEEPDPIAERWAEFVRRRAAGIPLGGPALKEADKHDGK